MLVHDEFMAQDTSSQASETRPKSGILTPASEGSSFDEYQTISHKRKRDHIDNGNGLEDLLSERFIVKPHPSSVHDRPRTLKPIALLSRSDFPLSCLDRARPTASALPDSRLYESHVKILELEQRMGNTPVVLIAQLDDKKSFYAIEYESRGLYVLFKLGSWVDLNKLCRVAVVSSYCPKPRINDSPLEPVRNGADVADTINPPGNHKYSKKKRLAIEAIQSMVKRPSTSLSTYIEQTAPPELPASTNIPQVRIQEGPSDPNMPVQALNGPLTQPSPADILDGIRSQYFETLYRSKGSTAYFAKGPLSRARAAFHLDYDSALDMKDLIEFLDSLVLSTTSLDKKYKDGLLEFVSKLDPENQSADEAKENARSRNRRPKKAKLGKNGLYNTEDAFIQSWWGDYDADVEVPGSSREDSSRSRISKLRVRETQLQMILILETLALQKLASASAVQIEDLPVPSSEGKAIGDKTSRTKAKKPRDLLALVDVHVDRLCIWQSLSAEEGRAISTSSKTNKDLRKSSSATTDNHAADILRDFCLEVVVPFFSARLPTLCDTICRKLGGPRISSPVRPPMKKSSSMSSAPSRPGAASKRAALTDSRRSLQRVLTDERAQSRSGSRGPSGAISLMRSATDPIIPGVKREGSETPSLTGIPSMNSQSIYASRAGVQKSKKFSQREVDLSFNALIDPKSKKANIEAELKDAISALKRPNRQLAGQAMVELAEKRTVTAASQSRKAKKPIRNPVFEGVRTSGVQILATPKSNRYKNMDPEPVLPPLHMEPELEPSFIPPSSIPRIPNSCLTLANVPVSYSPFKATPAKSRGKHQIPVVSATPTRNFSQSRLEYDLPKVDATPSRASAAGHTSVRAENHMPVIADTPIRPAATSQIFAYTNTTVGIIEIPPSPSPPRTARNPTIDSFMLAPFGSRQENICETPTKQNRILSTPIKTMTEVRGGMRNPLKPLSFTSREANNVDGNNDNRIECEIAATKDDGDIYKSLGWDDDDDL